jgi:hypothetical protein
MAFDFFGFTIKRKGPEEEKELLSPVPPQLDDDATIVNYSGGFLNTSYTTEFSTSDKKILINKYRELSLMPEIESAIDEIINEAIVTGDPESPVGVVLDRLPFSEDIKDVIQEEFNTILNILDFNENAYEIFKRWYIDGRLFFSVVIDSKNTKDGIQELRYIDPRDIEKIREVKEEFSKRGVKLQKAVQEYYIYKNDIKLPGDSVVYCNSGLIDYRNKATVVSYLHKSIKPYNQLRMLEDATVIYRLARAPERRVFKIGTGGLPKIKAEQYVNSLMNKFRNKIVYDQATGDLKDDSRTLSVLEDFWIPVGEDGKTTDISTLPGGQNLGEMGDVEYFKKKLYNALHVPITRITEGSTFNTGRAAEIDREEVKFNKFVKRLRLRFSSIFTDLLRTQLILKNIITPEEWDTYIKNNLYYDFRKDSHFAEYNEAEIMSRRIELASAAAGLGDNYFSESYIKKYFLKLSDEELKEMEIDKESIPDEEVPEEEPMDLGLSDLGPTSPDLTIPQPPPAEIPQETNPVELPDSPEL